MTLVQRVLGVMRRLSCVALPRVLVCLVLVAVGGGTKGSAEYLQRPYLVTDMSVLPRAWTALQ